MHKFKYLFIYGIVSLLVVLIVLSSLHIFASSTITVKQYEKFQVSFPYSGNYSNPNDPGIVDVEAAFKTPDGSVQKVPGFYYQGYVRSGSASQEKLTLTGDPAWMVRYAPSEQGKYTYVVTLTSISGMQILGSGDFIAVSSSNPGFVQAKGYQLVRDNGTPFFPLGVNAPWFEHQYTELPGEGQWGDGSYGIDAMLHQFTANGVNFFHVWTCSWDTGQGTPFAKPNVGCNGSGTSTSTMSQPDSWDLDYMTDQAHADNVYYIPVLKFDDQKNFTDADRIKARYFVARWGYSTNIVAWDFDKEGATSAASNLSWAAYMSSIDPYDHLRTTSEYNHYPALTSGNLSTYDQIFNNPLMTLVQTHDYTDDCATNADSAEADPYYDSDAFGSDPALALFSYKFDPSGHDPRDFKNFGKPSFFGETGIDACGTKGTGNSSYYEEDTQGLILKSEVWGMIMGSSGGFAPWSYKLDLDGATQLSAFKGASTYVAALPPIPDTAQLVTNFNSTSQVTASDPRIRIIGRESASFAMLFIQNTTGTPMAILRDKQTPTPITGTILLKKIQSGQNLSITWYDTTTGEVIQKATETSQSRGLTITPPQKLTQNIAVIVKGE